MHAPASAMPSASGLLPNGLMETFSSLASDENREAGVETELAEDEEFAAEEHAHRCCVMCNRTQFATLPGDEWVNHFYGSVMGLNVARASCFFEYTAVLHAEQHCQNTYSSYAVWNWCSIWSAYSYWC